MVDLSWNNGKLTGVSIYSGSGGNCRIRTLVPVKIVNSASQVAAGENPNVLNTAYGKPSYKKNATATLLPIESKQGFVVEFKTEKGKKYHVVPLSN